MFPFFNNYPGTDLHEIDLAYILKLCAEMRANNTTLTAWKAAHEVEYAELADKVDGLIHNLVDVISPWDSSIAYHIFSIVEYQGTNYMAIQDVPVGAMITNTDYWQPANTALEQINAIGVITSETKDTVDALNTPPVNVLTLGVKNDGSEDCSALVEAASETMNLYFPEGTYRFDRGVTLKGSIIGSLRSRGWITANVTGSIFDFSNNADTFCIRYEDSTKSTYINKITIIANDNTAIELKTGNALFSVTECNIITALNGIWCAPTEISSRYAYIEDCALWGNYYEPKLDGIGIYLSGNAIDSMISRTEVQMFKTCVDINAGGITIDGCHLWTSGARGTVDYWNGSNNIYMHAGGNLRINNTMLDTAQCLLHMGIISASVVMTNIFTTFDSSVPASGNPPTFILGFENCRVYVDGWQIDPPATYYVNNDKPHVELKGITVKHRDTFPSNCYYMKPGDSYTMQLIPNGSPWQEIARSRDGALLVVRVGYYYSLIQVKGMANVINTYLYGDLNIKYKAENGFVKLYVYTNGNTTATVVNAGSIDKSYHWDANYYGGAIIDNDAQATDTGLTAATIG